MSVGYDDFAPSPYNVSVNCSAEYYYPPAVGPYDANCTGAGASDPQGGFLGPPPVIVEFAKVLYGLVGVVGLCGNTLVIYVVLRFSGMQTVTNTCILNLALADEMCLVGLPFLLTTMVYASWPFGRVMCKVYMTTTSINQFTSSLLLTVMSGDRYVAVCHPIESPRFRTAPVAKFVCLTAWTLSALLMVPIYVYASALETGPYISCNIYWPENAYMNGEMAFTLYAFTLGFAVPLVLVLVFYFLVLCRLRRAVPGHRSGGKNKRRTHRRVTYLVLAVVTVYVICWLPYWCAQLWLTFMPPDAGQNTLSFTMMLLTGCLSYANSAVGPVLYAFLGDNFKKSFAGAFTCASAGRGADARPHVENSVFPGGTATVKKGGGSSSRRPRTARSADPSEEQSAAVTRGVLRNGPGRQNEVAEDEATTRV